MVVEGEGRCERIPSMVNHFYLKDMINQKTSDRNVNICNKTQNYIVYLGMVGCYKALGKFPSKVSKCLLP